MIEDLQNLVKILDDKVKPIVDAIEKADPCSEEYGKLLDNYNATMMVSSNTNRTLLAIAQQLQASKKDEKVEEGEEK